jgi:hypothetical protein
MLEKIIIRLEQLEAHLSQHKELRRREQAIKNAKLDINRLARMKAF